MFLFVVTAALQGLAPPCFVCFMIKRNRVCIPAMKFQRELFALISYSSWCIPDRDDVFALFQISGDIYGLHQNAAIFKSLPISVSRQLALERDPHGNVQVSLIETEQLLAEMVAKKLDEWKKDGIYTGKFATQHHFFGYEGRCAAPSNWDAESFERTFL